MLADVYWLSSMPDHDALAANLAELHVVTPAPDGSEGLVAGALTPRDSAHGIKSPQ
jgi:hypothetical protein